MYDPSFGVSDLVKCDPFLEGSAQTCATQAPWALDGCNWIVAGDQSGYYCTGLAGDCLASLQTIMPSDSGADANEICQGYGLLRGREDVITCQDRQLTNSPKGFKGETLCVTTNNVASSASGWYQELLNSSIKYNESYEGALGVACLGLTENDGDINMVASTDCTPTSQVWGVRAPGQSGDQVFKYYNSLVATATSVIPRAPPSVQMACLTTPTPVKADEIAPTVACFANADGRCILDPARATIPCPVTSPMPIIGSGTAVERALPVAGSSIWMVQPISY
jgi:hypothetical protein